MSAIMFIGVVIHIVMVMTSSADIKAVVATYSLPCQTMFGDEKVNLNITSSCQSDSLVWAYHNLVKVGFCTEVQFNNLTLTICNQTVIQPTTVSDARKNFYDALSKTGSKCREMAYSCIHSSPVSIVSKQQEQFCSLLSLNISGLTSERCLISADNTGCTLTEVTELKTAACKVTSTNVDQTFSKALLGATATCHSQTTTCIHFNFNLTAQLVMGKYCDVMNFKEGTVSIETCLKTGNACTESELAKFKAAACNQTSSATVKTFSFSFICVTLFLTLYIQM